MGRNGRVLVVTAALAAAATVGALYRSMAQEQAQPPAANAAPQGKDGGSDGAEVAAVRKTATAFVKAFNAGDAKAVAAFWTKDGEYIGPDGEPVRGREAIAKEYAEFLKQNPKAKIEVQIESIRLLSRHTALEEGTLRLAIPGEKGKGESRYSVIHVREDDGWRMASVREWVPDPAQLVSLQDLAWLIGAWAAKADDIEGHATYVWGEDKLTIRGRYEVKKDGKVVSSGTQIIGKDPARGLRSWQFDSNGSFGESVWGRDADRWVIDCAGSLPDGTEGSAVNILIPLGKDAFTWQSTERTVAGTMLPNMPPVRVTRVKAGK
ncbi:MAG TPA: SgcJ/EcaC family oxidoreductase [Gemmataceae bacterium]|nr:SgcJ/EcaC family oxidoreductase [Gemmataceae bacterium]